MTPSSPPPGLFGRLRARLSPTCREVSRLQSRVLDGPLSVGERFGLRMHLLLCRWCRRYGRQLRFLRLMVRGRSELQAEQSPRGLTPEARIRLRTAVRDAAVPPAE